MAQSEDEKAAEARRRERYDRPEPSGQYGSLDDRLGYGGGRDPGNLSEHGRDTTTHDYGGDENRDEHGWEGGSRPPEAGDAEEKESGRDSDPRR
jgi:hypothetical protein